MLNQFLLERFAEQGQQPALIWKDQEYSYRWLLEQVGIMSKWITAEKLTGQLVTLEEDYSPMQRQHWLLCSDKGVSCSPWIGTWLKPNERNISSWHR